MLKASSPEVNSATYPETLPEVHSIQRRFQKANEEHQRMLDQQSRDGRQARNEYGRRYNMAPPEGFDQWFKYATERNSLIIDDFDDIHTQLQPYRQFLKGGCDLVALDGAFLDAHHLMQVCIRNGTLNFNGQGEAWIIAAMTSMVGDFVSALPDLCISINVMDEPRILLPSDKLVPAAGTPSAEIFCEAQSFLDLGHQEVWSEAVLACPANSPAKLYPGRIDTSKSDQSAQDWKSATDICLQTAPIQHGALLSPTSLQISHSVRPILSNAALSTFHDILFPSLWRFERVNDYLETDDMPWEEKKNNAYWRGSTTGGYAKPQGWRQFHRHRFVNFTNNQGNELGDMVDVRFTAIIQCDEDACEEETEQFLLDDRQSSSAGWKSKMVFDIDGNGLSGRFYSLLRSNSAVMRQSLFREWHDSRILPWLHYVPLSMELTELKELLNYFLGPGDEVLAQIARSSKLWADAALRKEDMKIYMYRLLLEMSRR
jgi:hypothetical protein